MKNIKKSKLNIFDDNRFNQMVRLLPSERSNLIKDEVTNSFWVGTENCVFRLWPSGDGAILFGVGDGGTLRNITLRIFTAILRLKSKYLFWSNDIERNAIISPTKHELPGCINTLIARLNLQKHPTKTTNYTNFRQNFVWFTHTIFYKHMLKCCKSCMIFLT